MQVMSCHQLRPLGVWGETRGLLLHSELGLRVMWPRLVLLVSDHVTVWYQVLLVCTAQQDSVAIAQSAMQQNPRLKLPYFLLLSPLPRTLLSVTLHNIAAFAARNKGWGTTQQQGSSQSTVCELNRNWVSASCSKKLSCKVSAALHCRRQ